MVKIKYLNQENIDEEKANRTWLSRAGDKGYFHCAMATSCRELFLFAFDSDPFEIKVDCKLQVRIQVLVKKYK